MRRGTTVHFFDCDGMGLGQHSAGREALFSNFLTKKLFCTERWFSETCIGLACACNPMQTRCKYDTSTMQARCKSAMQRYPGNASPHASPRARAHAHASPMQARCKPELAHAATCKSEIATQAHMQLTCNSHTAHTATLTHATLTCNSHMQQHHMHLTHMHSELIYLACTGLLALIFSRACMCSSDARRMQRYPGNASTHFFASCLHGVACTSPMQVR